MTPKEARLILRDGALDSIIEASDPGQAPDEDWNLKYLTKVHAALKNLKRHVKKTAKRKSK